MTRRRGFSLLSRAATQFVVSHSAFRHPTKRCARPSIDSKTQATSAMMTDSRSPTIGSEPQQARSSLPAPASVHPRLKKPISFHSLETGRSRSPGSTQPTFGLKVDTRLDVIPRIIHCSSPFASRMSPTGSSFSSRLDSQPRSNAS